MSLVTNISPNSLRWRLKEATRPYHDAVESLIGIYDQTPSAADYSRYLETMLGFYEPMETALSGLNWKNSGIIIADRCKSAWIKSDLADLGYETHRVHRLGRCCALPDANSVTRGFGVLYVLEGATLGGTVILRKLAPELGIGPDYAGRFLASYGAAGGRMWGSYLAALEKFGSCSDASAAVEAAAIETFRALQGWLQSGGKNRPWLPVEARAE